MLGLSGCDLPRIGSYQSAVRYYERVKPIRGSDRRPIGDRRSQEKDVRMEDAVVHFRYHMTDVVSWVSPDEVRVTFWDSTSTCLFANAFLPQGLQAHGGRREMRVNRMLPKRSSMTFNHIDGEWVPRADDVKIETKFVVDRKHVTLPPAMKRAREYLAFRAAKDLLLRERGKRATTYSANAHALHEALNMFVLGEAEPNVAILNGLTDDVVKRLTTIASGAVKRVELPIGTMPKKSVWDAYDSLII